MKYLKMQDVLDALSSTGRMTFSLNDVAKLTGKNNSYLSKWLSTSKRVKRIEKGKYYLSGASEYEIASNIVFPSYVGLLSAFRYYDLTLQMPVRITVVSLKRHKQVSVEGVRIDFISLSRNRIFGYVKRQNAFISTVEKAVVDSLYLGNPEYSAVEEAFKKAVDEGVIDMNRLKKYALLMQSNVLINKIGFLLSSFGFAADELRKYKSSKLVILSKNGQIDRAWGVIHDKRV